MLIARRSYGVLQKKILNNTGDCDKVNKPIREIGDLGPESMTGRFERVLRSLYIRKAIYVKSVF